MKRHRSLLASSALLLSIALSGAANAADKWAPQVELEGKAGTSGRKIGVTKMMAPLYQDNDSVLFNDIRYKFDNQDSQEYNLGLGYREKINNDLIIGGYGFFDRLRSDSENLYSQGTVGIEALTEQNDLRMNVYVPESTKNAAPGAAKLVISGTALSVQGGFERALPGADFEIGQKIDLGLGDLRVYGGGYSFSADGYDSVTGPRGRMELKLNEADIPEMPLGATLTVGAELQRDDVRGTEGFGLVKLTVPLWESESKSSLTCLDKRMMNFIQRDVDVVSGNGGTEAATINGAQVNGILEMNSGQDFVSMVNATAENTILLVDGSQGTILSGTGTGTLTGNQAIIGGGSTVTITGAKSGVSFSHTFSGSAATVDSTGNGGDLIHVADNTAIYGLTINSASSDAIQGESVDNVIISDVTINNSDDDAIDFQDASNVTIRNTVIDGTDNNGMEFFATSGIRISGVEISNTDLDGIEINDGSDDIEISDVTINNAGDDGIYVEDSTDVGITDSTITGADEEGIEITESSEVEISGVTVDDAGDNGIDIREGSENVEVTDTEVSNSGDDGIQIFDGASEVLISDVTIDTAVNWGIIVDSSSDVEITNVDISDTGDDAIKVQQASSNIDISDVTVDTTGSDGFAFDDSSDITVSDVTITDSDDSGIDIENIAGATLSNITINDAGYDGIEVHGNSSSITISDSEINNSANDGLSIYETATDVTVDGLKIYYDSGDDAVDLKDNLGNITLDNLDIAGAVSNGFDFDGATVANLSGTGNVVTDTGSACSAAGATITGSITYNTNQTCP